MLKNSTKKKDAGEEEKEIKTNETKERKQTIIRLISSMIVFTVVSLTSIISFSPGIMNTSYILIVSVFSYSRLSVC